MDKQTADPKNDYDKTLPLLANERTFLAWIRTSIALMGFGFVLVRFSLFLREISRVINPKRIQTNAYSSEVGIIMIAIGILVAFFAYLQLKRYERRLLKGYFYTSSALLLFITLVLVLGGLLLIVYLLPIV